MIKGTALAVLAIMLAGCSGINASRGVSPATFLLPGVFGETKADATRLLASHTEPAPAIGRVQP
jgi:hypothetical protein